MPVFLLSVLNTAFMGLIRYLLSAGVVKWLLMALVLYGASFLVDFLVSLLPDYLSASEVSSLYDSVGGQVGYFLDYFQVNVGISMLLGAYVTRFMIRRIPILG